MRIFGIMVLKNESDVIESTLRAAAAWVDRVFILDNGSTDGTWDILQELASEQIVPWKQDFRPFHNTMRAEVFEAFRGEAEPGDWWCHRMDADEFYVEDPRAFLAGVPRGHHVVYKRSIEYVLTPEDVEEYEFTGDFARDRDKIRYFRPVAHVERRFFKYRRRFSWPTHVETPRHMGVAYPKPITVRHFPRRSPQQIQRRLDARHAVPKDKRGKPFRHVKETHWKETLVTRSDLICDDGSVDFSTLPLKRSFVPGPIVQAWQKFLYGLRILP